MRIGKTMVLVSPLLLATAAAGYCQVPTATGTTDQAVSLARCVNSIQDQAVPFECLDASSTPQLGSLYPISESWFIAASGNVGLGTTLPTASLNVRGSCSNPLTGAVTLPMGSLNVTGVGTVFTQELTAGDSLCLDAEVFTVALIVNDIMLDVTAPAASDHTSAAAFTDTDLSKVQAADGTSRFTIDKSGVVTIAGDGANSMSIVGNAFPFPVPTLDEGARVIAPVNRSLAVEISGNQAIDRFSVITDPSNGSKADTEVFVVRNDGRVGVGTTTPTNAFEVYTGSANSQGITLRSNGSPPAASTIDFVQDAFGGPTSPSYFSVRAFDSAGVFRSVMQSDATHGLGIVNFDSRPIYFRTANLDRVTIASSGNVGIGTTAPTSKLHVIGSFTATGTKAATVDTASYGQRKLYSVESPTVRFEDEGKGELKGGSARIELDPVFAETIEGELLVHVTPYGPEALYVAERGMRHFVVRSTAGGDTSFAWQVSAVRKGFGDVRLESIAETDN